MIMVAGDIMLDVLFEGELKGVAPGEPMSAWAEGAVTARLGGAGFVANAFRGLGHEVTLCGAVGADMWAEEINRLRMESRIISQIHYSTTKSTSVKAYTTIRGHNGWNQVARFDRNAVESDAPPMYASHASSHCDALVIVDMGEGFISSQEFETLDIPVFIDPRPENLERYPIGEKTTFICNRKSIVSCGKEANVHGHQDFHEQAASIQAVTDCGPIVATMDKDGAKYTSEDGDVCHALTSVSDDDPVVNTVGAGNIFLAHFVSTRLAGGSMAESVCVANSRASCFVRGIAS